MKFREYYRSMGKKGKWAFYVIAVISVFSFIFTISFASFVGWRLWTLQQEKLPLDTKIPGISLRDEQGRTVNIKEGSPAKQLLLFITPKCPACRMELSNLQYISKEFSQEKIKIFVISEASEEETKRFLKTYAVNFPVLMDPGGSLRNIFKFKRTPAFFLIDENDTIKYARIGYKKLAFDEMLIKEFLKSSKIPIEIFKSE